MKFDSQKHHRRSIRLKEYDYAQPGGYFITIVTDQRDLPPRGVKSKSIGAIVGSFKSAVTKRIGREHNATGIWQRNYYEHVIRNHEDWDRIHRYIESNLSMWAEDEENPLKHAYRRGGACAAPS